MLLDSAKVIEDWIQIEKEFFIELRAPHSMREST